MPLINGNYISQNLPLGPAILPFQTYMHIRTTAMRIVCRSADVQSILQGTIGERLT